MTGRGGERISQRRQRLLPSATPSPWSHLQGDHDGVGMGLQVPATLAALGPHEVLKLGNLFVEAIDVLVKESTEKQYQLGRWGLSQCLSHVDVSGRDGRMNILAGVICLRQSGQKGLLVQSNLWRLLWLSPCRVEPERSEMWPRLSVKN